ncbi:MAG TPA: hypothetical protein DCG75_08065 [Bacteroidales bacterium]|nr:hypothetical protein [Bacteroidales bacterium]
MSSLYQITADQRLLMNEIESLEGEITTEIEERLTITESQLQQKSIAYLEVIRQKEAFNMLIDNEVKRLQQLKKVNNNVIDCLNENLLEAVKLFGAYEVGTQKFSTRKSSQVIVEDVNSLPDIYKVVKVTEQADKMALKKAIEAGEKIEGVYILENLNLKIN